MDEKTSRPRRGRPTNPNRLTPEQAKAKDDRAKHWRTVMAMHRIFESAILARVGTPSEVIQATYWDIRGFHARHNNGGK